MIHSFIHLLFIDHAWYTRPCGKHQDRDDNKAPTFITLYLVADNIETNNDIPENDNCYDKK